MKRLLIAQIVLWSVVGLFLTGTLLFFILGGGAFTAMLGEGSWRENITYQRGESQLLTDLSQEMEGIDLVVADFSSDRVDIYVTDDPQLRVIHYGRGLDRSQAVKLRQSQKTLRISRPDYSDFFNVLPRDSQIEIYLPRQYSGRLAVDLSSGTVEIHDEMNLESLDLDLSSGKVVSALPLTVKKLRVELSSGNIAMAPVFSETFSIDLSSGRVKMDGLTGGGRIQLSSGSVDIQRMNITGDVSVDAQSGRCILKLAGEPSLDFTGEASSGRIATYFPAHNSSRHVGTDLSAQVGEGPYHRLKVDISSGSVSIEQA
ncbi:DUF4097 family beta strand repeat-containing protein [Oscillospiraceae bacterium MB08-C2-2]|nr:DUF4097 family beta strand repeat-containing protein [Oscillospiraceae bacterium MB08-C2-2]